MNFFLVSKREAVAIILFFAKASLSLGTESILENGNNEQILKTQKIQIENSLVFLLENYKDLVSQKLGPYSRDITKSCV